MCTLQQQFSGTHRKTFAVMVSYDSIIHICKLCEDNSAESFVANPIVVHMNWVGAEKLPVSAAASSSAKVFEWTHCWLSTILAAIEQFEDQATNRLLLSALEEYEDSGATQKEDVKKTAAKMLPSTLSKHCI